MLSLLAAFLSGMSSAANNVFVKQINYKTTQATLILWVVSIISNLFMAIIFTKSWPSFSLHIQWLYLVIFALTSVVASLAFVKGLKLIEAGAAGILGLLEVVFGVLFGVLFFSEKLSMLVITGIIIIIVSAALPYLKDYNR